MEETQVADDSDTSAIALQTPGDHHPMQSPRAISVGTHGGVMTRYHRPMQIPRAIDVGRLFPGVVSWNGQQIPRTISVGRQFHGAATTRYHHHHQGWRPEPPAISASLVNPTPTPVWEDPSALAEAVRHLQLVVETAFWGGVQMELRSVDEEVLRGDAWEGGYVGDTGLYDLILDPANSRDSPFKQVLADDVEGLLVHRTVTHEDEVVCCFSQERLPPGAATVTLPCSHTFEAAPIEKWLREESASCPLCRSALPSTEVRADSDSIPDDTTTLTSPAATARFDLWLDRWHTVDVDSSDDDMPALEPVSTTYLGETPDMLSRWLEQFARNMALEEEVHLQTALMSQYAMDQAD